MTESIVAFRGTKNFVGKDLILTFVDHNNGETVEIVVQEAVGSGMTEVGRLYVNAKVLYAAILVKEAQKYADKRSVTSSSMSGGNGSGAVTDAGDDGAPQAMSPKDLRNVAVQLLIDALAPGSGEGAENAAAVLLGPVVVAGATPAPPLDLLLATKPDTVTPFAAAADPVVGLGSEASTVADLLTGMVADASALDASGAALQKNSTDVSDLSTQLNSAFQADILSAFGAEVLESAVQEIIDDATVRRPRRGGPGAETMTSLAAQYKQPSLP